MRERRHGMRLLLSLAILLAFSCLAASATGAARGEGSAQVRGYGAILPGGNQVSAGAASEAATAGQAAGAVGGPAGSAQASVEVTASAEGPAGSARGTVGLGGVSLLGGRVTVDALRMSVRARAGPDGPEAGISEVVVQGVVVDGVAVAAGLGTRVEIAGVGTLVLLEQVVDGSHVRANALRLEVSQPGVEPGVGDVFVLGHLDASAAAGRPAPDGEGRRGPGSPEAGPRGATAPAPWTAPARPSPPAAPAPADPGPAPTPAGPSDPSLAPPFPPALGLPRQEAPLVPAPTGEYVFPVYGHAGYSDDYGAPRPVTGWHHGNDIFAPTGTPVLAAAEGTISQVGVNALGGNRLWLTDDAGNEFYYAHLSAYAPEAVDGARVRAGQVLGFVGNSGQAITTPPHLHFEVHPAGGDSVNPYPYLLAWEHGTDIPRAFIAAAHSVGAAPAAGATLVGIERAVDEPPATGDGLARVAG